MATKERRVMAAAIAAEASAASRRRRWTGYGFEPRKPKPERVRVELRPEKKHADAWTKAADVARIPVATWAQRVLNKAAKVKS